jgi:hypothetical protein
MARLDNHPDIQASLLHQSDMTAPQAPLAVGPSVQEKGFGGASHHAPTCEPGATEGIRPHVPVNPRRRGLRHERMNETHTH